MTTEEIAPPSRNRTAEPSDDDDARLAARVRVMARFGALARGMVVLGVIATAVGATAAAPRERVAKGIGGGRGRGGGQAPPSSSRVPESIEAIDGFCDDLGGMARMRARRRLFGLLHADAHDRGRWIEFQRGGDLAGAVQSDHLFDIAQVWSRDDGARAVSLKLTRGSGDRARHIFVDYCFRADGTLARMHSTRDILVTADHDGAKESRGATRERERYFDPTGHETKVGARVLDLATKLPAPTMEVTDDDGEELIYGTVATLPFYDILVTPRGAEPSVRR